MVFILFVEIAQIERGSTRDNIAYIHNTVMKIPRTPEKVRGDFLRSIISVFENFVSRDVVIVCADDCAFKLMTCSSSDRVHNVMADSVGIRAVGHCNEQVVGLDKLDFVDCEAAVQSYGGYCAELSV